VAEAEHDGVTVLLQAAGEGRHESGREVDSGEVWAAQVELDVRVYEGTLIMSATVAEMGCELLVERTHLGLARAKSEG
jgi:hypothetical protein